MSIYTLQCQIRQQGQTTTRRNSLHGTVMNVRRRARSRKSNALPDSSRKRVVTLSQPSPVRRIASKRENWKAAWTKICRIMRGCTRDVILLYGFRLSRVSDGGSVPSERADNEEQAGAFFLWKCIRTNASVLPPSVSMMRFTQRSMTGLRGGSNCTHESRMITCVNADVTSVHGHIDLIDDSPPEARQRRK